MSFSLGLPNMSADLRVDLKLLRELLRLPKEVTIVGVRPDATDATKTILEISGPITQVPASGDLVATYSYEHTTIVKFAGFKQP